MQLVFKSELRAIWLKHTAKDTLREALYVSGASEANYPVPVTHIQARHMRAQDVKYIPANTLGDIFYAAKYAAGLVRY